MQAWLQTAKAIDATTDVSAATLAEVTDGSSRDAKIRRVCKAVRIEPVSEAIGYSAGNLRASAVASRNKPRDLTIDAIVAATSIHCPQPAVELTSDSPDFRLLLAGTKITTTRV